MLEGAFDDVAAGLLKAGSYYFSPRITKPTKWHVRPAKTQISLGIRPG